MRRPVRRGSFIRRVPLLALFLFLVAGTSSGHAQDDAAKKDLKALQGDWTIAALEVNGMDVPADKLEGTVLTVKDGRYTVKIKDKVINTALIELDPKKDPKELNMTPQEGANKDKLHKAIYKIEGDTFKMARGLNPDQDRPDQFATWPGTNCFVITWKKKASSQ
ncbi:MAG: TIGR03067 domain-containing protein [Gemmataceae bacterium]|nr:TIGR03067 domain-containing protein [Gemmataceae bacterium]